MSLDGPLRAWGDSTLHRVILSADSGPWEDGEGVLASSALWSSESCNILYLSRVQDSPCCVMLDTDQSQAPDRVSELLERPSSRPGERAPGHIVIVSQVTYDPEMTPAVAGRLPLHAQSLEQLAVSPLLVPILGWL